MLYNIGYNQGFFNLNFFELKLAIAGSIMVMHHNCRALFIILVVGMDSKSSAYYSFSQELAYASFSVKIP